MFLHGSRVVSSSEVLALGDAGGPLGNGSRQHGGTARLLVVGKKKKIVHFLWFFLYDFFFFLLFCLFFFLDFLFFKRKIQ